MNFPIKRFLRGGCISSLNKENDNGSGSTLEVNANRTSEEVHQFYTLLMKNDELVNVNKDNKTKVNDDQQHNKCPAIKTAFNIKDFYRYAIENKAEDLRKFDYTNVDIDVQDNYGWTALMMAVCAGSSESVHVLLSLGANADIKDKSGRTAKYIAEKKGYTRIMEELSAKNTELKSTPEQDNLQSRSTNATEAAESYYCEICKSSFQETPFKKHLTSTIHQFNSKAFMMCQQKLSRFVISSNNIGLQLMIKQGWDRESGLGPTKNGRLYPIKTTMRKRLSGLGIKQQPARITHIISDDPQSAIYSKKHKRSRNDIYSEKLRERKRERYLRRQLN